MWESAIARWAESVPACKRIYLYGSRITGKHREDSDLDVAMELDPEVLNINNTTYTNISAVWIFNHGEWQQQLNELIDVAIHLEMYEQGKSQYVLSGPCKCIYEKMDKPRS